MKIIDASVVIPAFNSANTIGEQLYALQNQDFSGIFEIIVADNGSKDDTVKVVGEYIGTMRNLKLIKANIKKGAAHARNCGVEMAESDVVLFCDADDRVSSNWVAQMLESLNTHQIVAPRMEHFEISNSRFATLRKNMQVDGLLNTDFQPSLPFAGASGLGVKKDLHERLNGFDELFLAGEDWDYCWRAQLEAKTELVFNSDAIIHIRHRGNTNKFIKQAIFWGMYYPLIGKKYKKHGMLPPHLNEIKLKYKKLIVNLNRINEQEWRDRLVWTFFHDIGKLKGFLKFRRVEL